MNSLCVWRCGIALGGLFVASSELRSQKPSANPTGSDIVALLRAQGHSGLAASVLTQARGPERPETLDEIADSLVAIAVGLPGTDLRGFSTRLAARSALLSAGIGESGVVGIGRAVPYAGAADRLMLIAEKCPDVGVRGAALWSLTQLPNKSKLLPFLRQVAASQNPAAFVAVGLLAQETGPEGRSIARELYLGGQITAPVAKHVAASLAGAYGWR